MTPVKEELTTEKRSYSLKDIAQLEKHNLYSSIGKMIRSDKPTSQRAVFGKAARE